MVTPKGGKSLVAVSYHDTVNDLPDPQWWGNGPFAKRGWYALLEQSGQQPVIATAFDGRDHVCLPLERAADGGLRSLSNWYAFTWQPNVTLTVSEGPFEAICRDLRRITHRIEMTRVPGEQGWHTSLARWFRDAGWSVRCEPCDHNHVLAVNNRSFAEYWSTRPGQMRTTLKRKAKKVDVVIHDCFDPGAWAQYEAIYQESWKPEEGDPALLRRFAEAEGAAGRIRLGVAYAAGDAVAAQFWTVEDRTAYIHKLAHRESAKALSAGTTLSAALFERVIDIDAVDLVDFGTGDDAYKRDWMEADRLRYRIECLDPRQPKAWAPLAKRALRALAPAAARR